MCPEDPASHAVPVIYCDYRSDWLLRGHRYRGMLSLRALPYGRMTDGFRAHLVQAGTYSAILTRNAGSARQAYLGLGIAVKGLN